MEDVPESKDFSFPRAEESTLEWWDQCDAFAEQLKRTEGGKPFVFYDGPPFATGLPHYGHLLAGTIKDVVTRYASSTGHHVPRRFGWDCHGLPVEHEIDKDLGISSKADVEGMGIAKYNEACRAIVMRYSSEWRQTVRRIGRWIDFDDDYKTLDPNYMESVWWVFSQLFAKNLVYRGFKVMPFSTACCTPLSNFEAGLNYKDVSDPAVMVSFPLDDDEDGASMVAWTTTPWTLPSNLALCVHPEFVYARARQRATGRVFIVAEARLSSLPGATSGKKKKKEKKDGEKDGAEKEEKDGYEVLSTLKGTELAGRSYRPLFPFFASLKRQASDSPSDPDLKGAFRVIADTYVTDDSGTGVVHCAPAFGEDDMRVCLAWGVIARDGGGASGGGSSGGNGEEGGEPSSSLPLGSMPCPVDADGRFTEEVGPCLRGKHVKEADKEILAEIKASGRLVDAATIVHSYPYCWRSDTPLIYKAVPSWFVRVESIKEKLLEANAKTHWVPQYVKDRRFHNWLESARDWAVSRSRFWGTPLPVWTSKGGSEVVVVSSVADLEKKAGLAPGTVTDLHRHHVDSIEIPSTVPGNPPLKRVEDVFDCWFESGSMPYAQCHYPFSFPGGQGGDGGPGSAAAEEFLATRFPADFVAEGLDQTRGWFYTLMVLSVALFDGEPAFRNLVCNGLVLASDGKKMSKRLKNYPDPGDVLTSHGADALRLYLINSPVVRAEPLRFQQEGVRDVVKVVFLPWYNAYRFLVQSARRWEADKRKQASGGDGVAWRPDRAAAEASKNVLDRWLLSSARELARFVRGEMEGYRLYTVVPRLTRFIADLTNVYVRYNRSRLKGKDGSGGGGNDDDVDDVDDGGDDSTPAASAEEDRNAAMSTLHSVLVELCVIMAPFTPFLCEMMWRNLRKALVVDEGVDESDAGDGTAPSPPSNDKDELYPASVHWARFPAAEEDREGDEGVRAGVEAMQRAIELARTVRERGVRPLKQPLRTMVVIHPDPAVLALLTPDLKRYIVSQTNVRNLVLTSDASKWCSAAAVPDWASLGKKLGKGVSAVRSALNNADAALLAKIEKGEENVTVAGFELLPGEVRVVRKFAPSDDAIEDLKGDLKDKRVEVDGAGDGALFVALDLSLDSDLLSEGVAREVASRVQKARKTAGLSAQDAAVAWLGGTSGEGGRRAPLPETLASALLEQATWLSSALGESEWKELEELPEGTEELIREEHSLASGKFVLVLTRG